MKKLLVLVFAAIVGLSFISTSAFASSDKGQKIIIKKLKKPCGFNGGVLAKKHTQGEWTAIYKAGKLNDELQKLCPKAKPLKKKYTKHVYDFLNNFASDSGNVPSC
ncbi:cytochrome C [Sulfurospirillum sp. 1612]|uniref:cytochrome C n=1 Tax=Sulfurospirillum sp. 1612 TaxID=3094835 RepID=UPI002F91F265